VRVTLIPVVTQGLAIGLNGKADGKRCWMNGWRFDDEKLVSVKK
jgi:hypothetical protein